MADKHSLNYDVRELKLGASFTNNKSSQYHTIKYDFKPASVDMNKMATVDVGTNNQVTVTVPHLDGAGVPQTVFKGSQRPYTKECVLIIDRVTGEITLEKLSSNIQVKKTRQELAQKPRPLTPVTTDFTNTTQRSTSRTRVATTKRASNNPGVPAAAGMPPVGAASGAGGASGAGSAGSAARYNGNVHKPSAGAMVRSPPRQRTSPPQAPSWSSGGNSTLASLPMIGLDEPPPPAAPLGPAVTSHAPAAPPPVTSHAPPSRAPAERPAFSSHPPNTAPRPPARAQDSSSSSSSDSGSDSGSGSDSDDNDDPQHGSLTNGTSGNPAAALPSDVLNDDLCLSESGSDSD